MNETKRKADQITPPFTPPSIPSSNKERKVENEVPSLPTEIWMSIFLLAEPRTLACCALVCHDWHAVASTELIWKSLFFRLYPESHFDLKSLSEEESLSWREIYRDHVFFIKTVIQDKESRALQGIRKDAICPFVECSKSRFYLAEDPKVILEKKEETESPSVLFKGEAVLTHLAVENHFLFALTNEGDVVSCDIETKSIQKLDKKLTGKIRYKQSNVFMVHEGLVVKISAAALEVIPYACPTSSQVYANYFFQPFLLVSQIYNNRLYLVDQCSLSIWNLKNGQQIDNISLSNMLRFQFMCVKEEIIYLADQVAIYLVDLKNKAVSHLMPIRPKIQYFPHTMHLLGDHFLMVYYEDTKERGKDVFSMIDIRTQKFIVTSEIKSG